MKNKIIKHAISQMQRIGDALEWSDPIDEGYIHAMDELMALVEPEKETSNACPECGHDSLIGGMCANAKCKKYVPVV